MNVITVISPDKSVEEANEHVLSNTLLESAVRSQCTCERDQRRGARYCLIETHRKVSLRIFSLTSHGPLATYSRNVFAGRSVTLSRIFQILCRSVGSYMM